MKDIIKKYTNGEVTIIWQPARCIHSTICWKGEGGLVEVFNPKERPWIKPEGAATERIIEQVRKCPSGALSFELDNKNETQQTIGQNISEIRVEIKTNGPLILHSPCKVIDATGNEVQRPAITAFCRCGHSANKPYCDGSHRAHGFIG